MAGIKLLPCPFCGGEAFVNDDPTGNGGKPHMSGNVGLGRLWSVECDECGADAGFWQDGDVAIAAWNTRAERTCKNNAPAYLDFLCSECGFVHYHSEANDTGEGNEWNYCPNCGARVTPKNSETTPKVVSE